MSNPSSCWQTRVVKYILLFSVELQNPQNNDIHTTNMHTATLKK